MTYPDAESDAIQEPPNPADLQPCDRCKQTRRVMARDGEQLCDDCLKPTCEGAD